MDEQLKISCPKCGSEQISAHKKGFSAGKAVVGGVISGGVGLLAGLHGKDKIEIYCLSCGCKWKPENHQKIKNEQAKQRNVSKKEELKKQFQKLYHTIEAPQKRSQKKTGF